MQVSLSTKSIHGVTGIGADPEGVLDKSVYGITVDAETFYGRNALEGCGGKGFDSAVQGVCAGLRQERCEDSRHAYAAFAVGYEADGFT